ncbi:MAG: type II toxin-antitoxin system RelE/ParE family toxin [Bacteroidota bacterium]
MVEKVIWTPEAEKTFDAVISYLQQHWSEREIKNFIERINDVVEHISRHPLSYRSAGKEDVREALVTKQNLLLYRVSGQTIYLLYFWDTRKNPVRKHESL